MSADDRGPLQRYQLTWRSGHIEEIQAHQVLWPMELPEFFGINRPQPVRRVLFHGEINGQWQLVLAADEADVLSVRLLTDSEAQA